MAPAVANAAMTRVYGGLTPITQTTNSTILGALPTGHSLTQVPQSSSGYGGTIYAGHLCNEWQPCTERGWNLSPHRSIN